MSENKLNEYCNILKNIKNNVKKSEELQGPNKIKKVTLKDFKKENNNNKEVSNNNKVVVKLYEIKFSLYIFNKQPTPEQ